MSLKHKMILLGDSQVGKTSLILKYIKNEFNFNTTTTMAPKSFYEKEIRIKNNKIDLVIWDTVGQDKFKQITKINIKGAKMVLLIFDLTNIESFKNLDNWYNLVKDILDVNNVIIGVVGNKNDLIECIDINEEEINNFVKKINSFYYSTTATEGDTVNNCFDNIIEKYFEKFVKINDRIELNKSIKITKSDHIKKNNKKLICCK